MNIWNRVPLKWSPAKGKLCTTRALPSIPWPPLWIAIPRPKPVYRVKMKLQMLRMTRSLKQRLVLNSTWKIKHNNYIGIVHRVEGMTEHRQVCLTYNTVPGVSSNWIQTSKASKNWSAKLWDTWNRRGKRSFRWLEFWKSNEKWVQVEFHWWSNFNYDHVSYLFRSWTGLSISSCWKCLRRFARKTDKA